MPHAPTAALERRLDRIRHALRTIDLDALIITALPNILYLTNFTGSSAIVVVTADAVQFVTDFRYQAAMEAKRGTGEECPNLKLVIVTGSYDEALATVLLDGGLRRVGFEAAHLTVARFDWLSARLAERAEPSLVPTQEVVEGERVIKDDHEVAMLREGGRRLSAVARDVVRDVRRGMTERELALAIDCRIHAGGFEKTSFDTIVASGPNAALPHARPTERKLTEGDLVVLDFGGVYDSYCVDLTRTVSVGRAGAEARRVYSAVLRAHDLAIGSVRPGVAPWDVDGAARQFLAAEGLAEAFGHGTGHGLGIEVHESPRVSRRRDGSADERLAPGMVFTIEPGAYLQGWGGVRIEDDVLVTGDGVELLTDVPTELLEI